MKILILGGTQFVGRHIAEEALARGHEVTLFNRGQRNPDLFPNLEKLQGDRDNNLEALKGRRWDVAIDTSGYIPRHVRQSAQLLADAVEHYTFISTISVYDSPFREQSEEDAPLATLSPENEGTEQVTGETYGALKVLCERAANEVMPGRVLTIRPGIIVGPYDSTDRFTYWIMRVADGNHPDMVIPALPESVPMQVIDGRDLARFTLDRSEAGNGDTYNAVGPDYPLTLARVLNAAEAVTGGAPTYHSIPEATLLEKGITPWMDLPLWLSASDANLHRVSNAHAVAQGLSFLPLERTIADTYAWRQTLDESLRAGWSREREAEFRE